MPDMTIPAPQALPLARARRGLQMLAVLLLPLPVAADPVGHWLLDEGSGSVAADASPSSLDGTVQGSAAWTAGQFGSALSLDGTDDLVVVADDNLLDLATSLTISVWLNPSDLLGNRSLVSKDGAFELDLSHAGTGSYSLRLANQRQGAGSTALTTSSWQHVAVTWDGSTVRYYFQGQPDGSATYIGALPVNGKDLGLGGRPSSFPGGLPQFLYSGLIDDVRVYARALSDADIAAVYQNQPLPPAPPDFDPPTRFDGVPSGVLLFGTTDTDLVLRTDEAAECRWSTLSGVAWSAMPSTFAITGGTYHANPVSGLQNGGFYNYFVRCRDTAGNVNGDDYALNFSVEASPAPDLDPPQLSSPSPVGTVPAGTVSLDLAVSTDEAAECRYGTMPGIDFNSMSSVFQQTGGTAHQTPVTNPQDGTTRVFYVRCRDASGNAGAEDFVIGFWQAEPPPGAGFHPTDLADVAFFVESRHGLGVATCKTAACQAAGDNVPLAQHYCDTDLFPYGCARRWEDHSAYTPPIPFEPPEWLNGRDHGQDDLDKPGVILDCINGRPCLRGGLGVEQYRGLEIEPNQFIGPVSGAFSLYVLARPVAQADDYYYLGFAGTELVHEVDDDSLRLRLGFGAQIPLTGAGVAPAGEWSLIEVHRQSAGGLSALVNGYDQTAGTPSSSNDFYFRFLMTSSRVGGMEGDLAAALVVTGDLDTVERQSVRDYFAAVYALDVGTGGPPPVGENGIPSDVAAFWSFDDESVCAVANHVAGAANAAPGPACPGNGPADLPGRVGTALDFDGVDDDVVAPAGDGLDQLNRITLSAWVRTTETTDYRSIIDKRDAATDGFDLYLVPGGKPFMRINDKALQGSTVLADGQWHHVVGVYDGDAMWLYVDGVLETGRTAGVQVLDTTAPTVIGRGFTTGPNKFHGSLDQIRIYDRALDATEISALAQEGN